LFEQLHDPRAEGIALAERIAKAFAAPITTSDLELHVSASIGIAVTTFGGDADRIIKQREAMGDAIAALKQDQTVPC
jgi:GGDEF domain-containing protein